MLFDASFLATGAIYSLLSAPAYDPRRLAATPKKIRRRARRHDALDAPTKREIDGLICEHSIAFSRAELGFADFAGAHRAKIAPVRHRLVGAPR